MKDASFYQLLADELATRQRILPCGSILCVPQSRSLLAYQKLNIHDLYNHVLIPSSSPSETDKIGHFETLNGHSIQVDGSTIRTAEGFKEERIVRILLSEEKTIFHQTVRFVLCFSISPIAHITSDHGTSPQLPSNWRYPRSHGSRRHG